MNASWPEPAGSILTALEALLRDLLAANLRGIYVYGSLAFGCYNPVRSDVDVLVLIRRAIADETYRPLVEALRNLGNPSRLEISFLSTADLDPWRHPCPCELHFSRSAEVRHGLNHDLAAEITNARARAVALVGPSAEEALPHVPEDDFLDAIMSDLRWARAHLEERPGYAVLNGCRVVAYRRERTVMSKADAGVWGLRSAPERFRPLIADAAAIYAGEHEGELDRRAVASFLDWAQEA